MRGTPLGTRITLLAFKFERPFHTHIDRFVKDRSAEIFIKDIEAELNEVVQESEHRRLEGGRAAVVRYRHHPERDIQTGIGWVTVKVPKIRSRYGESVV